jgi:hypothetical protein
MLHIFIDFLLADVHAQHPVRSGALRLLFPEWLGFLLAES